MKHRFLYIMALLLTVATGAWAQDPDPIDLTPSADGTVWTLSTMPEYDVELEMTYYTDEEIAEMEEAAYTEGVELTDNGDGTWTLASMPGFDIELEVEYETTYAINTAVGIENGTVKAPAEAAADEKVTLDITPAEGYELGSLKITCDDSGSEINYDVVDFSFTMPAEGVHVFATFQPSSKVEIAHGIATYCSLKNLDFTNEDVKAYIVSAFTPSTGEAVLTRVYDVPAGTGLVLIGENGSYEIPEGTGATVVSNLLKGVTSATVLNAVDETNTNFILTTGEYDLGFYPVLDGTTLAAGKAYLPLPTESLPLSAGAAIRFVFEDRGGATYIDGVAIGYAGSKMEKGVYYNLNGQRVGRPTKAGIYILDGKKVYVK